MLSVEAILIIIHQNIHSDPPPLYFFSGGNTGIHVYCSKECDSLYCETFLECPFSHFMLIYCALEPASHSLCERTYIYICTYVCMYVWYMTHCINTSSVPHKIFYCIQTFFIRNAVVIMCGSWEAQ